MPQEEESAITHYVVMVEEEPDKAVGVWFPDLPGCVSAGDTLATPILVQGVTMLEKANHELQLTLSAKGPLPAERGEVVAVTAPEYS